MISWAASILQMTSHMFFCRTFVSQLVTGYLPSVILQLFLYAVPPTMLLFSALEGPISRSGRKKSACLKVLYFTIWNVFFVNVFSGSVISQLNVISSPKEIPSQLAKAVPRQVIVILDVEITKIWSLTYKDTPYNITSFFVTHSLSRKEFISLVFSSLIAGGLLYMTLNLCFLMLTLLSVYLFPLKFLLQLYFILT